ncbi:hypothetical protein GCM10023238_05780 [Streptomyces heliomycini]
MEVAGRRPTCTSRCPTAPSPATARRPNSPSSARSNGQTSGDGLKNLAALRRRFPRAVAYVDEAARAGEEGRLVRTWLGRTCPPAARTTDDTAEEAGIPVAEEDATEGGRPWAPGHSSSNARARGRFARNFVVQGSAADWALLLLAALRRALSGMRPSWSSSSTTK